MIIYTHPKIPLLTHPHPDPPLEGEGIFIILCDPALTCIHPHCSLLIAHCFPLIATRQPQLITVHANVPLPEIQCVFSILPPAFLPEMMKDGRLAVYLY